MKPIISGLLWWSGIPVILLIWYHLGNNFTGAGIIGTVALSLFGFLFYKANKEQTKKELLK